MSDKFCIDCKHSINALIILCKRPTLPIDVTTGKTKTSLCSVQRTTKIYEDTCDIEAKYFEPKVVEKKITWYNKLFNLFDPPAGT
jgi:hypothetical protein